MSINFDLKSYLVKLNNKNISKEELDKQEWRRHVLEDHLSTTLEARKIINDSRTWRKRLERSCDEIKEVTNAFNKYDDKLKTAWNNLSDRIEQYEKDQEEERRKEEERKLREEEERRREEEERLRRKKTPPRFSKNHYIHSTTLSEKRRRNKFIPDTIVPAFRIG